ncbi:MAG TPA: hypothetical protein VIV12_30110 [Streptosporangiaceae bacterium]
MKFTVWQRKPTCDSAQLARSVEEVEIVLVHWTEEGECRVVSFSVDNSGTVTVEHSTTEPGAEPEVEHVTRVTLHGWED